MGEIGDSLRERRMALRIDVHEVEEATKIRAKYLRALENEEFDLLPGPTYVRSFLRSYADFLELDAQALLDRHRQLAGSLEDEVSALAARTAPREPARLRRWPLVIGLVVLLLVVVLLVGLLGGGSGGS